MKTLDLYINEKLHLDKDTNVSVATAEEDLIKKLKKALVTIYNDKLTMSTDWTGSQKDKFYEINPETLGVNPGDTTKVNRLINYCKKIDGIISRYTEGLLNMAVTYLGNEEKTVWLKIIWKRGKLSGIRVSKLFYDSDVFPKDQSNVSRRSDRRLDGKYW